MKFDWIILKDGAQALSQRITEWGEGLRILDNPYAQLMRLDKPIGTWLLLLPCWWGISLTCARFPNIWLMFLFALGAIVMRSAGCVVNDIVDQRLDAGVERTRLRPLASGVVKTWQAVALLVILLTLAFGILLLLNRPTVVLGCLSLFLISTYPFMKRITWWPQAFLGLTFNWGILMGGTAASGGITVPVIAGYVAGFFWTLAYDTIYSHQDIHDDEAIGIKSTARLFGSRSKIWVLFFYLLTLTFLIGAGWLAKLASVYYVGLVAAALFAFFNVLKWTPSSSSDCLERFKASRDFGLLILLAIILGKLL